MSFRKNAQNRRKIDSAQRKAAAVDVARRHGPRIFRTFVTLAILMGLGFGGVWAHRWALTSPMFALDEVQVTGAERLSSAEIARTAGLTLGLNLVSLDARAAEHLLEAHPWVRHVALARRFPSKVVIDVQEQSAVAMVSLGDLYLLNDDGIPFKKVEPTDGVDVPLITGVEREAYVKNAAATMTLIREGLKLAKAYDASGAGQRARLSEVRVSPDGCTALTENGQEVRFSSGMLDASLARLFKVRSELARRGLVAEVIHLDNRARPDRVTVKLFGAQAPSDVAR